MFLLNLIKIVFATLLLANQGLCLDIWMKNSCESPIWPAYASVSSSNKPPVNIFGGYYADVHTSQSITVPDDWEGLIWARQDCDFSRDDLQSCSTGSCPGGGGCTGIDMSIPKGTMAEFTQKPANGSQLWFDVKLDGFSLTMQIQNSGCAAETSCKTNFTTSCPSGQQLVMGDDQTLICDVNSQLSSWYDQYCPHAVTSFSGQYTRVCERGDVEVEFCPDGTTVAPPPDGDASKVASGSPSPGQSNPTGTSVALASQLAGQFSSQSIPSASFVVSTSIAVSTLTNETTSRTTSTAFETPSTTSSRSSSTATVSITSLPLGTASDAKMSRGAIVGVSVAGGLLCLGAALALSLCMRRRRRLRRITIPHPLRTAPRNDPDLLESVIPITNREENRLTYISPPELMGMNMIPSSGRSNFGSRPTSLSEKSAYTPTHNNSQVSLLAHPDPKLEENDSEEVEIKTQATSLRNYLDTLAPPGSSGEIPPIPDLDAHLRRLFEDRRYEHHLLRFLSQRMDAPTPRSSGTTAGSSGHTGLQQETLPPSYPFIEAETSAGHSHE